MITASFPSDGNTYPSRQRRPESVMTTPDKTLMLLRIVKFVVRRVTARVTPRNSAEEERRLGLLAGWRYHVYEC